MTRPGSRATHFGFRTVDVAEKQSLVDDVFHSVARRYDLMNDLMSGGLHRAWKSALVTAVNPPRSGRPFALIDVAGGTGDIAMRVIAAGGTGTQATVVDINRDMLEVGRERAARRGTEPHDPEKWRPVFEPDHAQRKSHDPEKWRPVFGPDHAQRKSHDPEKWRPVFGPDHAQNRIAFVEANAEALPFADRSFDAYTIAFGIRNVPRIETALAEAFRVLRPGGQFHCLEFSTVDVPGLDALYDLYSFNVIPTLGRTVAGDAEAYRYLVESIRRFPKPQIFADMATHAGFRRVTYRPLTGGIVALHSGWRL